MSRGIAGLGVLRCRLRGRRRGARVRADPKPEQKEAALQPTEPGGHKSVPWMLLFENHTCLLPIASKHSGLLGCEMMAHLHSVDDASESCGAHTGKTCVSSVWIDLVL